MRYLLPLIMLCSLLSANGLIERTFELDVLSYIRITKDVEYLEVYPENTLDVFPAPSYWFDADAHSKKLKDSLIELGFSFDTPGSLVRYANGKCLFKNTEDEVYKFNGLIGELNVFFKHRLVLRRTYTDGKKALASNYIALVAPNEGTSMIEDESFGIMSIDIHGLAYFEEPSEIDLRIYVNSDMATDIKIDSSHVLTPPFGIKPFLMYSYTEGDKTHSYRWYLDCERVSSPNLRSLHQRIDLKSKDALDIFSLRLNKDFMKKHLGINAFPLFRYLDNNHVERYIARLRENKILNDEDELYVHATRHSEIIIETTPQIYEKLQTLFYGKGEVKDTSKTQLTYGNHLIQMEQAIGSSNDLSVSLPNDPDGLYIHFSQEIYESEARQENTFYSEIDFGAIYEKEDLVYEFEGALELEPNKPLKTLLKSESSQDQFIEYSIHPNAETIVAALGTNSNEAEMISVKIPFSRSELIRIQYSELDQHPESHVRSDPFDTSYLLDPGDGRDEIFKFLGRYGINFLERRGSSFSFDGNALWITHTKETCDLIQHIIDNFDEHMR